MSEVRIVLAVVGSIVIVGAADLIFGIVAGMWFGEYWSARLDSVVSGLIACLAIIQWLREPAP